MGIFKHFHSTGSVRLFPNNTLFSQLKMSFENSSLARLPLQHTNAWVKKILNNIVGWRTHWWHINSWKTFEVWILPYFTSHQLSPYALDQMQLLADYSSSQIYWKDCIAIWIWWTGRMKQNMNCALKLNPVSLQKKV